MRRLKIELDVYNKTCTALRKKLGEVEAKLGELQQAKASLEAEKTNLQSQLESRDKIKATAASEEIRRDEEFQQRTEDRVRQELRIQWNLDHQVP
jgi:peptidoglycan hydrolase CwlO-like protein